MFSSLVRSTLLVTALNAPLLAQQEFGDGGPGLDLQGLSHVRSLVSGGELRRVREETWKALLPTAFARPIRGLAPERVLPLRDALEAQGVAFESAMAKSWNMRLFKHLRREADKASRLLAEETGACEDAAERGVMERFSHKLAIAPTASISIICGGTSACIEPIPANIYTHKTLSGSFIVKNPYLEKLLQAKAKDSTNVWNSI